jgi:hypothetical protein
MNAISESVRILREAGVNEKQMLAHLEVIEQNMRQHAVSPQIFGDLRVEMGEKFIKIDAKFNELETNLNSKFKEIDERFNKVDERLIKLEQKIDKAIFRSTGILISFIALMQFFKK